MIAQFITISAETIGLLVAQPNRGTDPDIALAFPDDIGRQPISRKESRRTFARSARYEVNYSSTLKTAAEITELRIFLNALKAQPIALPLWLDAVRLTSAQSSGDTVLATNDHPVRSGLEWIVANSDFSLYEIVHASAVSANTLTLASPGLANNWPKDTLIYPLVFGYLTERPQVTASTPSRGACDFKFKESSAYARRLNQFAVSTPTVGAGVPNLSTLPLWPIHPSWTQVTDLTETDVSWSTVGFGRQDASLVYTLQPNRRGLEMEFRCRSRRDIAAVEKFFADRKGRVSTFCIPTFRNDLELAADVAIGDTTLTIKASEFTDAGRTAFQGDPYVALVDPIDPLGVQIDQTTIEPLKLGTVSGTTLNLAATVTAARVHAKATTRLSHLLLVRLVDEKLEWKYSKRYGTATARLKFLELPNEYTAPSTVLKEPAYLYLFTESTPYPQTWRFTSYEDAIVIASGPFAGTYTPANISHKSLKRSLQLDQNKIELKTSGFAGNPLALFFPFQLEGPLNITIGEANAADLTAAVIYRSSGEVVEPNPTLTEASAQFRSHFWDRKFPNFILSTSDNLTLFHAALGLTASTWKVTGLITVLSGTTIRIDHGGDKAANWFASGWIETGTGANYESRSIISSASISGSVVELVIEHPLLHAAVSQSADLYPGYDGTIDTLETKFAVRANFGGHPFVPDTAPNVKGVQAAAPTGAKK